MDYLFKKSIQDKSFEDVLNRTTEILERNHFGILCDINVAATLKKKLNVDFDEYRILGACNPPFANDVLNLNKDIGVFLPCNLIVYRQDKNTVCVGAVNPYSAMISVENPALEQIADNVKGMLQKVIDEI